MARRAGETEVHAINEFRGRIPSLPPVKSVNTELYMGPTEESNWVIYGHLLVGAYPASTNDIANAQLLTSILRLGVTTFVCLQQEYQHEGVTETQWRSGEKLRPYIFDAIRLVDSLPDSFFSSTTVRGLIPRGKPDGLEFVHFPIVDCSIANDASVLQLCHDLSQRLLKGEVMYLHCWGGHGRTGTVVSIMLGLLYGLSPLDAMRWVQFCHDLRVAPMGTASPQTETQRQQVIRVLNAVRQAQIVHSGVSSGAGASGYASSSNNNGVNPEVVVKNPRSPRALLSPQPAVSGARPGSLSMALPQNHHHQQQQQSKHSHIADNTTTTTTTMSSSSVSSHVLNADANSGESSSTSSQKGTDQPQRASAAALAAASIPRTAQTAQPKPRSGSVPLRNTNTQVSMARSPVASWQTGTKTTNNQASTRIRRLSSEQSSGQTNQGSNSSSSSHPSPHMSAGVTIGGNVTDSKNTSSTSTRNSTSTSSSNSNNTAVIMSHLSPRPEAVVSVNNFTSSDAKSGQGGNQGQNQSQFSPSAVREAILTDPRATSVAPLASSTATVLGLGPLLAANRSSIVFSSTSTATSNTTTSTGGGSTTNINTTVTNRPSDVTAKERDIHRNFDGKNDESERNDGNKNNLQENNSSNDSQQQIMRPSSADAAIQSRRSVSSTLSFNPSNTNSNINPIVNDHQTNTSNIDTIQQTNSATSINTHSTTPSNTTIDASSTRDTTDKLIAQTQAHIRSSRTSPGFGGAQQTNLLSSSQSNTNTSQQTTTSSPRSPVPGGYSSRAYGYSAVAAASGGGGGHFSQSQTNNSTPPRGSGGGGGGSSQIHQQNVTSSVSSSPRSSAAAAGLASAIAAYSVSVSTATSPGQGSTQVPRSRLAIARQQSREPHTISQSMTSNGVGTPLLAAALGGSTSESFDKKTSTSPSPFFFFFFFFFVSYYYCC
jgi:hypothetical protein